MAADWQDSDRDRDSLSVRFFTDEFAIPISMLSIAWRSLSR